MVYIILYPSCFVMLPAVQVSFILSVMCWSGISTASGIRPTHFERPMAQIPKDTTTYAFEPGIAPSS
jgi:hypothetical protein